MVRFHRTIHSGGDVTRNQGRLDDDIDEVPARLTVDLRPGSRATLQVAVTPGMTGAASCTPYLDSQPLGDTLEQGFAGPGFGVQPPVTCEIVAR